MNRPQIIHWHPGLSCVDEEWEAAYRRFETPEEEIAKFTRRLHRAGVSRWSRDSRIVELFCGRGNGLEALERLGFEQLEGVDLSPTLLRRYGGSAQLYVADCRDLARDEGEVDAERGFAAGTVDGVIIHGGLHHLGELPGDLERTMAGIHQILRPATGRLVFVEPWWTPFLRAAHASCKLGMARRAWPKLDALAVMIEREGEAYEQWLDQPKMILGLLDRYFRNEKLSIAWGKILYVGSRRR